jgi:hypothetical protein
LTFGAPISTGRGFEYDYDAISPAIGGLDTLPRAITLQCSTFTLMVATGGCAGWCMVVITITLYFHKWIGEHSHTSKTNFLITESAQPLCCPLANLCKS